MLDRLRKFLSPDNALVVLAPVEGEVLPISEVPDPTFGEEILGKGVAIRPAKGRVVSPVSGTISIMFDTGHAVSILSDDGVEILVHIGLDTVKLKGQFFTIHCKAGDKVAPGDLLIEFDMAGIAAAGFATITPVVICNTADYSAIETLTGKPAQEQDEIMRIKK